VGSSQGHLRYVADMLRNEGPLRFYRGIAAPLMQEPLKRSVKFVSNRAYNDLVIGSGAPSFGAKLLCGFLAGSTEAFCISPFEAVKIRMQAKVSACRHLTCFSDCVSEEPRGAVSVLVALRAHHVGARGHLGLLARPGGLAAAQRRLERRVLWLHLRAQAATHVWRQHLLAGLCGRLSGRRLQQPA
jgi:hypothetical protein